MCMKSLPSAGPKAGRSKLGGVGGGVCVATVGRTPTCLTDNPPCQTFQGADGGERASAPVI